jgi:hypothetical protein
MARHSRVVIPNSLTFVDFAIVLLIGGAASMIGGEACRWCFDRCLWCAARDDSHHPSRQR